jgi:hypothetical protein
LDGRRLLKAIGINPPQKILTDAHLVKARDYLHSRARLEH